MSVIEHDVFVVENDLNANRLDSLVILGVHELKEKNIAQLGGFDKFVVNTVIHLNDVGAPEDVFLSVFRNKKILKVPAGRLFLHEAASNQGMKARNPGMSAMLWRGTLSVCHAEK